MTDIDMEDEDDFPQEITGHVPSHRFGEFIGRMWLSQEEKEYLKQIKVYPDEILKDIYFRKLTLHSLFIQQKYN